MSRETPREYLVVPFAEKDAAKALEAKWDAQTKAWYVAESADRKRLKVGLPENRQHHYVSPETEFREAMQSISLEASASDPVADGKSRRVRAEGDKGAEKAAYYSFHLDGAVPAELATKKAEREQERRTTQNEAA
ncbi:MAG: DUF5710 domain-containing protein [Zoogloeaceae bacterium]|jgi:hypothetical protein|nr:DUF5710 domain-containing protein [Zoogloeaceae bacterium]